MLDEIEAADVSLVPDPVIIRGAGNMTVWVQKTSTGHHFPKKSHGEIINILYLISTQRGFEGLIYSKIKLLI